ncbi:hypothetical protein RN001_015065 [Aquatica leii]|uniref:Uncharacterized protein n=1 Tax=Aquatica leii TaxID=1421715 RepID=A0AAN7P2U6_9COLE|nr:hypothetical protein RN001_015065 [Aquatica leii]
MLHFLNQVLAMGSTQQEKTSSSKTLKILIVIQAGVFSIVLATRKFGKTYNIENVVFLNAYITQKSICEASLEEQQCLEIVVIEVKMGQK